MKAFPNSCGQCELRQTGKCPMGTAVESLTLQGPPRPDWCPLRPRLDRCVNEAEKQGRINEHRYYKARGQLEPYLSPSDPNEV